MHNLKHNFGNYARSFIMSVILVAVTVLAIVFSTVYRSGYFVSMFSRSEYYGSAMKAITTDIAEIENKLIVPVTGTKEVTRRTSVMASTLNWQNLANDINGVVEEKYASANSEYEIQTEAYKSKFLSAALEFAEKNKVKLGASQKDQFKTAAEQATKVYCYYVRFPGIDDYAKKLEATRGRVGLSTIVLIAAFSVVCIIHFKKNKWKHRAVRFFIHSVSAAGLVLFAAPLAIFATKSTSAFTFSNNELFSSFISEYINGILGYMIIIGLVFVVTAILLVAFVYSKMYKKINE